jgi:CheY-like chemotaxis protein
MAPTLLLADDNVTTQRFIGLAFANQGVNVVHVSDGQAAIDRLAADPPDIVLAAANLSRIDGYNIARFVRGEPTLQRIPVVLLTGAFDAIDEHRVRQSGASGVLIKPFESAAVINRVKELLGMGKTPEPAAAAGRLVTSSGTPPGPLPADAVGADHAGETADQDAVRTNAPPAHPSARHHQADLPGRSPLGHDSGTDAGGPTVDYVGQLDAAFDSLDAQLTGHDRSPAPRASHRDTGSASAARMSPAADDLDPQAAIRTNHLQDLHGLDPLASEAPLYRDDPSEDGPYRAEMSAAAAVTPPAAETPRFEGSERVWHSGRADAPSDLGRGGTTSASLSSPRDTSGAPTPGASPRGDRGETSEHRITAQPPVAAAASDGVADAFAALLAAEEQGEPLPPPYIEPPASAGQGAGFELTDEVIDRIAERVVHRLTHGMLGYTVTKTVTDVSERLVKEEIARIRAAADRHSSSR